MSIVLSLLGILLAAAGAVLIGFGLPIIELGRGATMILSGSFAVVGGLLLIGLAAVVAHLGRIAALLRAGSAARQARVVEAPPVMDTVTRAVVPADDVVAPVPAAASPSLASPSLASPSLASPSLASPSLASPSVEVSSTAIERLRSSLPRSEKNVPEAEDVPLSPNGSQVHPVEPRMEPPPVRVGPMPRSAGAAAVESSEPRLDFLFRPRQPRQEAPQEPFDALWPRRSGRERQADPRVEVSRAPMAAPVVDAAPAATTADVPSAPEPEPLAVPPAVTSHEEELAQEQRSVAILKSGVVDGMAYTLYADGSIEAQLPQGTVRFGSIAELRAHIENHS